MNLYIIDGHSYFYRAFHAIKNLSNSKGFPTNAIFGFTNMLFKLVREKKPDAIAAVLDSPEPTERHKLYDQYKAQRPEMPSDLAAQIPRMKEIIRAFNIPVLEMSGYEADDIICSLAKKAAAGGASVYILTGDKDMTQAVGGNIRIYDPMKEVLIEEKDVVERYGVPPGRMSELMALTGDPSDNIPGVKGIGEKTAKELLTNTTLDQLIEHPEKIGNERLRKMISENLESIRLSRTLATIDSDLPVDIAIDSLKVKDPDWPSLLRMFTEFEFTSMIRMVPSAAHKQRAEYIMITDADDLRNFLGIKA